MLVVLVALIVLLVEAPWISVDDAGAAVVRAFTAEWQGVADGCGLNCAGCGVVGTEKHISGYIVEIEYACGILPADVPIDHQRERYYVSPFVTVHKLPPTPADENMPSLTGTEWILVSLQNAAPLAGTRITLAFDETVVRGYAGCNFYGTAYTTGNAWEVTFSELEITEQDCQTPSGVMAQEITYIDAIAATVAYQVEGDQLRFLNADGQVLLVFQYKPDHPMHPEELVNTRWQLVSLNGKPLVNDAVITMHFLNNHQVSGFAACREYSASYTADGDDLSFPMLTMHGEGCPVDSDLWQQESSYIDIFDRVTNYILSDHQLEITSVRGESLVFIRVDE